MSARNRPAILLLAALAPPLAAAVGANQDGFTNQFPIAACDFKTRGGNAFLKLQPGRQLYLSNEFCADCVAEDGLVELWITMLPETRVVTFFYRGNLRTVRTRVMEEYETVDGGGNSLPDAWLAGVGGARPGILMPDRAFLLGSRYFQEFAPNARDRAEHTSMSFEVEVPAGTFQNCVEVTETTTLEPGQESLKTYCPNIGMVRDGDLELIAVNDNAVSPSATD